MNHKKNEENEIVITDIGSEGEGIGHLEDGYTLFIQGGLPGDTVRARIIKAQKKYGIGRLIEIITPSPDRIIPPCPLADKCGGCQIMSLSYAAQCEYKARKVHELLVRVGGFDGAYLDSIWEGINGYDDGQLPMRFRNKAQYPAGTDNDGHTITGFYAPHSHRIAACDNCLIGAATDAPILSVVRAYMDEHGVSAYDENMHTGIVRHILIRTGYATGEIQVCVVINADRLPYADELIKKLCEADIADMRYSEIKYHISSVCISVNKADTNVIMGNNYSVLYGRGYITDMIDDVKFRISPLSFYQVNPMQTRRLYGTVLEYAALTGTETVWDLYCGIGTISLFLARAAGRVYGVEAVSQAIEDARENARLNGIENVEFYVGKAEELLPVSFAPNAAEGGDILDADFEGVDVLRIPHGSLSEIPDADSGEIGLSDHNIANMPRPDVIVVDPPRKGCDRICLDTILAADPSRIVYVSCDPATLARDLKYLCAGGEYHIDRYSCTDMFVHSVHVETVVLLSRE